METKLHRFEMLQNPLLGKTTHNYPCSRRKAASDLNKGRRVRDEGERDTSTGHIIDTDTLFLGQESEGPE